jgi:hypothetical protein
MGHLCGEPGFDAASLLRQAPPRVAALGAASAPMVFPTHRPALPVREPTYPHRAVFDVRSATAPPRLEVKAPGNDIF